jgi:hypothetical protein
MPKITIWITRSSDQQGDDMIKMFADDDYSDMIRIMYRTPDIKKAEQQFYLSRKDTIEYVKELFTSLFLDTEPFESIQLATDMHPCVMFSVADLEPPISTLLISMITKSLYTETQSVKIRK